MTKRSACSRPSQPSRSKRVALGLGAAGLLAALSGCVETESFLFDPAVVGRWEYTPTTVPILSRIASIEGPEDEFVEVSDVTAADLIPEVIEYRIGPGDRMIVEVYDLPEEGRVVPYQRDVDTRGFITIPQLGEIHVAGRTVSGAEDAIAEAMRPLVTSPVVSVVVGQQRQQRYSVMGAVPGAGPYTIPAPDFRLLEALTAAGGFSEAPEYIYIIRHIPLAEEASGRPAPVGPSRPAGEDPEPPPGGLIDIIDELSRPRPPAEQPGRGNEPDGSPGIFRNQSTAGQPPIDLVEDGRQPQPAEATPTARPGDGNWIYINDRWVRVQPGANGRGPAPGGVSDVQGVLGRPDSTDQLFTQRIIRVPVQRLVSGDPRVNIVIRPNDIIRVPPPPQGNVYMLGQINRGGVYQLAHQLTLRRVIAAAGGFNAIAVPERIDLTRMVGPDRQATIRLNGRAIFRGAHPDIFLKPNDEINVGTSFWATPMAVIRNGFRATYGFGFLLDRNFGNDVFGAPPTNQFGQ